MIDFAQLQPGFVFARRYRIESLLSTGGMGAVYVVRHVETDARLALKVMRPEIVENADARRRFAQEARVASMIESTHVVAVTDAGVDEQLGVPFLVMELLQGRDLGDELAARGRIPGPEVVAWLTQVARALDKAHAKGIIHRDLKPENLFLVRTDEEPDKIKVLDFGIAKFLQGSGSHTTAASGTPLYMAPEQTAQGNLIGPATDTWALGLIAYTLLTGRPYWQAETIYQLFAEVLSPNRESPNVRAARCGVTLPTAFDEWLLRAIAPDPSHRWQRASEAVTALHTAIRGMTSAPIEMEATLDASTLGARSDIAVSATTGAPRSTRSTGVRIAVVSVAVAATLSTLAGVLITRRDSAKIVTGPSPSASNEPDAYKAPTLRDTIAAMNPMILRGTLNVQRHEVTRKEYAAYHDVLESRDRERATPLNAWTDTTNVTTPNAPVTWVTREQATAFCNRIDARLPTSDEWSLFADRAPSTWPPSSHDYAIGYGATSVPDDVEHAPADVIAGVHDLVGNVKEWTMSTKDDLGIIRGADVATSPEQARVALTEITQKAIVDDQKRVTLISGMRLGFRCVR